MTTPLIERLRAALPREDAGTVRLLRGDLYDDMEDAPVTRPAAVLVAVTDRPEPGVILTRRTDHLPRHAGQIAFPGGRMDDDDPDIVSAALREAEEEIALPPDAVTVVGAADHYRTITGFEVTPVIGIIPPDLALEPEPGEVGEIFEVPLAFLLDVANHVEATVEWQGRDRHYYEILWQDRRIWGATAAMIVNLSRRMRQP
ncbi:CoA pyrophosphatase [Stakelama saccharophila]|uniref:CoA pyrophosphatase n=1 Tax=Stakelama saccharophila TaxID=3075605 RepID=A0ABZ0B774_9SPHN|nr:CoA pyrophosphatase [Stakelama sp. W311]WNO52966.1 CoA pyrophosphatase [Stakelama sp. W311]